MNCHFQRVDTVLQRIEQGIDVPVVSGDGGLSPQYREFLMACRLAVNLVSLLVFGSVVSGCTSTINRIIRQPIAINPLPKSITLGLGGLALAKRPAYANERFAKQDRWAMEEALGRTVEFVAQYEAPKEPAILIGEISDPIIQEQLKRRDLSPPARCFSAEGYVLDCRPDGLLIAGADARGTFYGIQTLRQLLQSRSPDLFIPTVTIYDWPDLPFRALHYLHCANYWNPGKLAFQFDEACAKQAIRRMAALKMNTVVLTLGNSIHWQSHPEIALDGAWTIQHYQEFVAFIRQHHIEVIPELNLSTAHDAWLGQYRAEVGSPHYQQVVSDVISETIEITGTPLRYFHLGYDEEGTWNSTSVGLNPIIRPMAERWASLPPLLDLLQARGVQGMVWADILCNHDQRWKWEWDLLDKSPDILNTFGQRCVFVDWMPYTTFNNYSTTDELVARKLPTIIASWALAGSFTNGQPENVARHAMLLRDRGVLGAMQTIWPAGMNNPQAAIDAAAPVFWNTDPAGTPP